MSEAGAAKRTILCLPWLAHTNLGGTRTRYAQDRPLRYRPYNVLVGGELDALTGGCYGHDQGSHGGLHDNYLSPENGWASGQTHLK
jgi:hypothetical protein